MQHSVLLAASHSLQQAIPTTSHRTYNPTTCPYHCAGAVVKAAEYVSSEAADYLSFLSKGQLPPANISLVRSGATTVLFNGIPCCFSVHLAV